MSVPDPRSAAPTSIDLTLADLISAAAKVKLPPPRSASTPPRVIDLRVPAPRPRPLEIPAATIDLVEGYADSHF